MTTPTSPDPRPPLDRQLHVSKLRVMSSTGSTVSVDYETLVGNQPETNKNRIGIWQGESLPAGTPPVASVGVKLDAPADSEALSDLTIAAEPYVLGYSLDAGFTAICATAGLAANGASVPGQSVHLDINPGSLGPSSLVVRYRVPTGYPSAYFKNWVGLFEGGGINPFSPIFQVLASVKIDDNASSGAVAINHELRRRAAYSLVYFMGEPRFTAASVLTFQTKG